MFEKGRTVIISGNWKMYKTIGEAISFLQQLIPLTENAEAQIYLAVPFTAIQAASQTAQGSKIVIGAQNLNDASEGAFTGEIAGKMLVEAGARFVIIGHSERRLYFNEDNHFLNRKAHRALKDGLKITFCIGETEKERLEGQTETVLEKQLREGLAGLTEEDLSQTIIAYEPIWAIGTDLSASPQEAENAHRFCRECISDMWSEATAEKTTIQYGGSVKPDNAASFLSQPHIDGLLIGGASLSPLSFSQIINCVKLNA